MVNRDSRRENYGFEYRKVLTGQDFGKLCVIIGEKDGQKPVVDGILKPVQSSKRKARSCESKSTAGGMNEAIKREILLYRKESR